jgi:hypothetical protein
MNFGGGLMAGGFASIVVFLRVSLAVLFAGIEVSLLDFASAVSFLASVSLGASVVADSVDASPSSSGAGSLEEEKMDPSLSTIAGKT